MTSIARISSVMLFATALISGGIVWGRHRAEVQQSRAQANAALRSAEQSVGQALLLMREPVYDAPVATMAAVQTRAAVKARLGAAAGLWRGALGGYVPGTSTNALRVIGDILEFMAQEYTPPTSLSPRVITVPPSTLRAIGQWCAVLYQILARSPSPLAAVTAHSETLVRLHQQDLQTPVIRKDPILEPPVR